jgi:hypothetical protein
MKYIISASKLAHFVLAFCLGYQTRALYLLYLGFDSLGLTERPFFVAAMISEGLWILGGIFFLFANYFAARYLVSISK